MWKRTHFCLNENSVCEREREIGGFVLKYNNIFMVLGMGLGLFGFRGMRERRWKGSIIIFIFVLGEWRAKTWATHGCAL